MKNILVIAYYYPPYTGVASKRPSYWHESFLSRGYNSKVITATKQENPDENIIYVAPEDKKGFFIKDEGSKWFSPLKEYFTKNKDQIDIVIITGGPFLHFPIASFLKKKFACKVILDFRDPFAVNPRFKNTKFKILIKSFYERKFLKDADEVITVNKYCSELLVKRKSNVTVINNGYDERIVDKVTPVILDKNRIHFVYAGKFAFDRNPLNFIKALKKVENNFVFHYLGPESEYQQELNSLKCFVNYGVRPYNETISILKGCDFGLIFTSGSNFESTTKIFDYIASGLNTVIVTEQQKETGSLHDLTKDLSRLYWLSNSVEEISQFLNKVNSENLVPLSSNSDFYRYSRKAGFELLLRLIEKEGA